MAFREVGGREVRVLGTVEGGERVCGGERHAGVVERSLEGGDRVQQRENRHHTNRGDTDAS